MDKMNEGIVYGFKHLMERLQEGDHAHGIVIGEVEP